MTDATDPSELSDLACRVRALTVRVRRDGIAVRRRRAINAAVEQAEDRLRASRIELSRERWRLWRMNFVNP